MGRIWFLLYLTSLELIFMKVQSQDQDEDTIEWLIKKPHSQNNLNLMKPQLPNKNEKLQSFVDRYNYFLHETPQFGSTSDSAFYMNGIIGAAATLNFASIKSKLGVKDIYVKRFEKVEENSDVKTDVIRIVFCIEEKKEKKLVLRNFFHRPDENEILDENPLHTSKDEFSPFKELGEIETYEVVDPDSNVKVEKKTVITTDECSFQILKKDKQFQLKFFPPHPQKKIEMEESSSDELGVFTRLEAKNSPESDLKDFDLKRSVESLGLNNIHQVRAEMNNINEFFAKVYKKLLQQNIVRNSEFAFHGFFSHSMILTLQKHLNIDCYNEQVTGRGRCDAILLSKKPEGDSAFPILNQFKAGMSEAYEGIIQAMNKGYLYGFHHRTAKSVAIIAAVNPFQEDKEKRIASKISPIPVPRGGVPLQLDNTSELRKRLTFDHFTTPAKINGYMGCLIIGQFMSSDWEVVKVLPSEYNRGEEVQTVFALKGKKQDEEYTMVRVIEYDDKQIESNWEPGTRSKVYTGPVPGPGPVKISKAIEIKIYTQEDDPERKFEILTTKERSFDSSLKKEEKSFIELEKIDAGEFLNEFDSKQSKQETILKKNLKELDQYLKFEQSIQGIRQGLYSNVMRNGKYFFPLIENNPSGKPSDLIIYSGPDDPIYVEELKYAKSPQETEKKLKEGTGQLDKYKNLRGATFQDQVKMKAVVYTHGCQEYKDILTTTFLEETIFHDTPEKLRPPTSETSNHPKASTSKSKMPDNAEASPTLKKPKFDDGDSFTEDNKKASGTEKFDVTKCLTKKKKRSASNECLISWHDVDEFNSEKETKRDIEKIKIDNEKYLKYLKENRHQEEKNEQILKLKDDKSSSINNDYNDLLRHVQNSKGYENYVRNKDIKEVGNFLNKVKKFDTKIALNTKLSLAMKVGDAVQLSQGIQGTVEACVANQILHCGLGTAGIVWPSISSKIESALVQYSKKSGKMPAKGAKYGKMAKLKASIKGVKFGTKAAKAAGGAMGGLFDIVYIGLAGATLAECEERKNSAEPCEEIDIRDSIASIVFSTVSFVSGIVLNVIAPGVGNVVQFALAIFEQIYSFISALIHAKSVVDEFTQKYDLTSQERNHIYNSAYNRKDFNLGIKAYQRRLEMVEHFYNLSKNSLKNADVYAYASGLGPDIIFQENLITCCNAENVSDCGEKHVLKFVPAWTAYFIPVYTLILLHASGKSSLSFSMKNVFPKISERVCKDGHIPSFDLFVRNEEFSAPATINMMEKGSRIISRAIPKKEENIDWLCLPNFNEDRLYEASEKRKIMNDLYECENGLVIANRSKSLDDSKIIIYDGFYITDGKIVGNNHLNNVYFIFPSSTRYISSKLSLNYFHYFTRNSDAECPVDLLCSSFYNHIDLSEGSDNILDFSSLINVPIMNYMIWDFSEPDPDPDPEQEPADVLRLIVNITNDFYDPVIVISDVIRLENYKSMSNLPTLKFLGRKSLQDSFDCFQNFKMYEGFNFTINGNGGFARDKMDIIYNCLMVEVMPFTAVRGTRWSENYIFFINNSFNFTNNLYSEIEVNGTGHILFQNISVFSNVKFMYHNKSFSFIIDVNEKTDYKIDIQNFFDETGEHNFVLFDIENKMSIFPVIEENTFEINTFRIAIETEKAWFDCKTMNKNLIRSSKKDYVLLADYKNQEKTYRFGSHKNDMILIDEDVFFAQGGEGEDVYITYKSSLKHEHEPQTQEVIINNWSEDKSLDIIIVSEQLTIFKFLECDLFFNEGHKKFIINDYRKSVNYRHLIFMDREGMFFMPLWFDDLECPNNRTNLTPPAHLIHPGFGQNIFVLSSNYKPHYTAINSFKKNIKVYKDDNDLLLSNVNEKTPFLIKIENFYVNLNVWSFKKFYTFENGHFFSYNLMEEAEKAENYIRVIKKFHEGLFERYVWNFNLPSSHISHNMYYNSLNNALAVVDESERHFGILSLKNVAPDEINVFSSNGSLVLRDIIKNHKIFLKEWDNCEVCRIYALEFDTLLEPITIYNLNKYRSGSDRIQTLLMRATYNYNGNKKYSRMLKNRFKCSYLVQNQNLNVNYECFGFSSLQDEIDFYNEICTEMDTEIEISEPSYHDDIKQILINDLWLKGYPNENIDKCKNLMEMI